MTRQELERQPHWQATFERTRPDVTERFDCLMRTITGGYYWHTPDYQGLFAAGATRTYHPSFLASALASGHLKLVAGSLPDLTS